MALCFFSALHLFDGGYGPENIDRANEKRGKYRIIIVHYSRSIPSCGSTEKVSVSGGSWKLEDVVVSNNKK